MKFELGDTAVVLGWDVYESKRTPTVEGTVIASSSNSVKLRILRRFLGFRWVEEKWFCIAHTYSHVERVEEY